MKVVRFAPLAASELVTTARHYEDIAPGLGETFITAVEAATEQIAAFPESAPAFGPNLRRKLVSRFPFSVIYSVRNESIWVVALMHQSRGPIYVAERLKDHT
jgi:plasmid stabilization system protein ParE